MKYKEEKDTTKQNKIDYISGINKVLDRLRLESTKKRYDYFKGFLKIRKNIEMI